ncbi:hypothetical protein DIPPA_63507 [Diplonema papillatum]|nr:hypothetical protein DIPPA_50172 [Diplonema papillatum]KAJ9441606.1 hypothetical protein DIPPA_63507 [Diplonema papillatum]
MYERPGESWQCQKKSGASNLSGDVAFTDFLQLRKGEMQDQIDSLSVSLHTEMQRRVAAESMVAELKASGTKGRDQGCEPRASLHTKSGRYVGFQHGRSGAQRQPHSPLHLLQESEAFSRHSLHELQEELRSSMQIFKGGSANGAASLDLARKAEEVARQSVRIVDLEQEVANLADKLRTRSEQAERHRLQYDDEVARLHAVLQRNEELAAESTREFLKRKKAEMRAKEVSLQETLACEMGARAALEEELVTIRSKIEEFQLQSPTENAELLSKSQHHIALLEERLKCEEDAVSRSKMEHSITQNELSDAQQALAKLTFVHERRVREMVAEQEADVGRLEEQLAKMEAALDQNRRQFLALQQHHEQLLIQVRVTAMGMCNNFDAHLPDPTLHWEANSTVGPARSRLIRPNDTVWNESRGHAPQIRRNDQNKRPANLALAVVRSSRLNSKSPKHCGMRKNVQGSAGLASELV